MPAPATLRFGVESLHALLSEKLAELGPREQVAAVMRVFLEVSSLPCDRHLWSLEFAFDEDDGRIARLVACFVDRRLSARTDDTLHGYEVELLLPRVLPPRPTSAGVEMAGTSGGDVASDALVPRFERALGVLGAYRSIENIEFVSAEALLL